MPKDKKYIEVKNSVCPNCGKKISSLNLVENGLIKYTFEIGADGVPKTKKDWNDVHSHYYCSNCDIELTDWYNLAAAFLEGRKLKYQHGKLAFID